MPVLILIFMAVEGFTGKSGDEAPTDVGVQNITRSSAVITWYTERKTRGVVEYGTSPDNLNSFLEESDIERDHKAELTLLTSATTYYYQLRINGKTYDNEGSPWVFITKTKDGKDVVEEVKGITTQLKKEPTPATISPDLTANQCIASSCDEVRLKIGNGCLSADYVRCLTTNGESLKNTSQATGASYLARDYVIPPTFTPTPTQILIVSNICSLGYLQSGANCTEWMWDGVDTKPLTCREAFNRYVLQCRNTSFTQSTSSQVTWYYNGALTNYASTSAKLKVTPINGETVYCQVRAEDEVGGTSHSTAWVRAEKKCTGL
jgi:hypothetical protein